MLIERCVPGAPLRGVVSEEQSDEVVSALLKRLWIEPPPGHPFRPLSDMMALWAGELEQRDSSAPHGTDRAFVREALRLMRELPSSTSENALLTTDLHATNVLAATREPWLVIDPKPYVGDPAYDPVQHMLNCLERTLQDPHAMIRRLAGLADVDAQRLRLWLFVRCVQESVHDRVEEWAERAREVAAQVAP
jgi:streptomycin 6-kinase